MSPDFIEILTLDALKNIWSSRRLRDDFRVDDLLLGQVG